MLHHPSIQRDEGSITLPISRDQIDDYLHREGWVALRIDCLLISGPITELIILA
ncbi:MAG: hypothetical protein Q8P73_03100 [bacterium]|nr:hypothetical protein [bacterium]